MHRFYLRQANAYTWNPYLHTCNLNLLSHHWLHQPTAIAAATAAAAIAAAATRFFQKNHRLPQVNMFGNL